MNSIVEGKCIRMPWGEWAVQLTHDFEVGKRLYIRAHYNEQETKYFDSRVVIASGGKSIAEICRPDGWYLDSADGTRVVCWDYSSPADWNGKITGVNVPVNSGDILVHRTCVITRVSTSHDTSLVSESSRLVVASIIDNGRPLVRPASEMMTFGFAPVRMPTVSINQASAVATEMGFDSAFLPAQIDPISKRPREIVPDAQFELCDDDNDELELLGHWQAHEELQYERAEWLTDWSRYIKDDGFEDGFDDDHWWVSDYGFDEDTYYQ